MSHTVDTLHGAFLKMGIFSRAADRYNRALTEIPGNPNRETRQTKRQIHNKMKAALK